MVGGTIHRERIHRETSRALVLHLLWQPRGAKITAQKKCALTTPSFLSRGTLYNYVGVVKRHFYTFIGDCVWCGRFFFLLTRNLLFCPTKARILNPAAERWFHQPSIRSSTTDHDSCFELPACAGRQGAQSKTRSHLRDQGAPRAALHGSHLRARGCGAQQPVQLHGKFAGDGHFSHARALVKFQSSIHTL
jgi:hypothetical protein